MEKTEEMEIGFSFCVEIEEEIMLRLPIKSLSRFNCVSKTWYNRFTNSEFAHKHLKRQANNKLNLMLHGSRGPLQSVSFGSSNYFDKDEVKTIPHNQPLLHDFIYHKRHNFNVVGSCNGLLLVVASTGVVGGSQVIYIWNPTTGQYKTLPQLSSYIVGRIVLGFGPDLTTTDHNNHHYKVLLLKIVSGGDSESETSEFRVHIYTTHTNSWKMLIPNFGLYGYFNPHPQGMVLAYDNLHSQAIIDTIEDDPLLHESIICFDLKDDKFRVLPMAPGTYLIKLCHLNGDLCAFSFTDNDFTLYGLWRMKNFGVMKQECWTKICSIDCPVGIDYSITFISPLHFLEGGQILLYAKHKYPRTGQPFIIAYNTENKKVSFPVQGTWSFWSIPVVFEESFISPNAVAASTAE